MSFKVSTIHKNDHHQPITAISPFLFNLPHSCLRLDSTITDELQGADIRDELHQVVPLEPCKDPTGRWSPQWRAVWTLHIPDWRTSAEPHWQPLGPPFEDTMPPPPLAVPRQLFAEDAPSALQLAVALQALQR